MDATDDEDAESSKAQESGQVLVGTYGPLQLHLNVMIWHCFVTLAWASCAITSTCNVIIGSVGAVLSMLLIALHALPSAGALGHEFRGRLDAHDNLA